jgi:hypothetical protein
MDKAQQIYNLIKDVLSTVGYAIYNLSSFIINSVTAIANVLGIGKSGLIRENYNNLSSTNKDNEILINSVAQFSKKMSDDSKTYYSMTVEQMRGELFDGGNPVFDSTQRSALNQIAINRYGGDREFDKPTKDKLKALETEAETLKASKGVDSKEYNDAKDAYTMARDEAQIALEEKNVANMYQSPTKRGAISIREMSSVLNQFVYDLTDSQLTGILNSYQEAGKNISSREELFTNLLQSEMGGVYDNELTRALIKHGGNVNIGAAAISGSRGVNKTYLQTATEYQQLTAPIAPFNPPDKKPDVTDPGLGAEAEKEKGKAITALKEKYQGHIAATDSFSYATTGSKATDIIGDTTGARLLSNMFGRETGSSFDENDLNQMNAASITIRDKNNQKQSLNLTDIISAGGQLDDDFSEPELKSLLLYLAELKQQNPEAYENLFKLFPGLEKYRASIEDNQNLLSPLGQNELGNIEPKANAESIENYRSSILGTRDSIAEKMDDTSTVENQAVARATFEKSLRELSIDPDQLINLMSNPEVLAKYKTEEDRQKLKEYLENLQQNLNTGENINTDNVYNTYQDFISRLPETMVGDLAWSNSDFIGETKGLANTASSKATTLLSAAQLTQEDLALEYSFIDTESGFEVDFNKLHRLDDRDPEGKEVRNISTIYVWSPVAVKIIEITKNNSVKKIT